MKKFRLKYKEINAIQEKFDDPRLLMALISRYNDQGLMFPDTYTPEDIKEFMEEINQAGSVLVVSHTPRIVEWGNFHKEFLQGKYSIIYAARDITGYAVFRRGKLDFIECSQTPKIGPGPINENGDARPEGKKLIEALKKMRKDFMWMPLISFGGIKHFNETMRKKYTVEGAATDAQKQFEVIKFIQDTFRLNVVFTMMDLSCVPEAVSIANRRIGVLPITSVFQEKHVDQQGYLFGNGFEFSQENIKKLKLPDIGIHQ